MHVQVFVRAFEGWTSDTHQNIKEKGSKCYPFIAPAFKHTNTYPLGRRLCCAVHWVGWYLCCSGDVESEMRGGYRTQVGCDQRWVWAVEKERWIPDGKGWAKNVADIVYLLTESPGGNSYRLTGKKKKKKWYRFTTQAPLIPSAALQPFKSPLILIRAPEFLPISLSIPSKQWCCCWK